MTNRKSVFSFFFFHALLGRSQCWQWGNKNAKKMKTRKKAKLKKKLTASEEEKRNTNIFFVCFAIKIHKVMNSSANSAMQNKPQQS